MKIKSVKQKLGKIYVELARDNLTFSSAHFPQRSDGTSESLHGHNYTVTTRIEGVVDQLGYIVDFGVLKEIISFIISDLNHKVLLPGKSKRVVINQENCEVIVSVDGKRYIFPNSDVQVLPIANTTCEELAAYIGKAILKKLPTGQLELKINEAPGQGASWRITNE